MTLTAQLSLTEHPVRIRLGQDISSTRATPVSVEGDLVVPEQALGVVLFAHGSGSGRLSPRNRFVAQHLQDVGFATLLMDLLTDEEAEVDALTGLLHFDILLLSQRLIAAIDWLGRQPLTAGLPVGLFGASTGAAAALAAATHRPQRVAAVVTRGGRPDLASRVLLSVRAPTLLIVGGNDEAVVGLNQEALRQIGTLVKSLTIVPGAGHLFDEEGSLETVAGLAARWFDRYLNARTG